MTWSKEETILRNYAGMEIMLAACESFFFFFIQSKHEQIKRCQPGIIFKSHDMLNGCL